MPLSREIMKIGSPVAIYSTPITRTLKNRDLPDGKTSMMPGGLEERAFPADFPIQPTGGEFVMGVFKDDRDRLAVFVANHNTYAEQDVTLKLSRPLKAGMFSRTEGKWQPMTVENNTVRLNLAQAGGELLRFEK